MPYLLGDYRELVTAFVPAPSSRRSPRRAGRPYEIRTRDLQGESLASFPGSSNGRGAGGGRVASPGRLRRRRARRQDRTGDLRLFRPTLNRLSLTGACGSPGCRTPPALSARQRRTPVTRDPLSQEPGSRAPHFLLPRRARSPCRSLAIAPAGADMRRGRGSHAIHCGVLNSQRRRRTGGRAQG